MKHDVRDFPFRIADVASLMGFYVPSGRTSQTYDCIFCGKSKKLNINFSKNVYGCNYCGVGGGMVALYADYYNLTPKEAYDEICEGLHLKPEQKASFRAPAVKPSKMEDIPLSELASPKDINRTYSMLLSVLTLSEKHKSDLLMRGLTLEQIEEQRFKSTPIFAFKQIVSRLTEAGCVVEGIPGFYEDTDGKWTLNFSAKCSGFLIPMRAIDGTIRGMQIRLDHPKDGQKYIWFSSASRKKGVSSGSPLHFIGDIEDEEVYMTEGGLKGIIAHYLSGKTFLCNAGVNQYKHIKSALQSLPNVKRAYEAFDMDKLIQVFRPPAECQDCKYKAECEAYRNYKSLTKEIQEQVSSIYCMKTARKRKIIQDGCMHFYEICKGLKLDCRRMIWNVTDTGEWLGEIKGIDDYYYKQQFGGKQSRSEERSNE